MKRASALALLVGLSTLGGVACPAVAGEPADSDDGSASGLLARASAAAHSAAYSGTQYVSAWNGDSATSVVVDVHHLPGQGSVVEVRRSATGGGGAVFEDDNGPPADLSADVTALAGGPLHLLERNYQLAEATAADPGQTQVVARRKDGSVAARFWIDRASGLLVRREVYDSGGQLVRASAFVDLRTKGPAVTMPTHLPPDAPAAWGTRVGHGQLDSLRQAGWRVPEELPGQLALYDVREEQSAEGTVLHLGYSDGLSTVSVFAQRGHLVTKDLTGWQRAKIGGGTVYRRSSPLPQRVIWSGSGMVYTVVADAPEETVTAVVESFPHRQHHRGLMGRIGHGFVRVASWVNPFA